MRRIVRKLGRGEGKRKIKIVKKRRDDMVGQGKGESAKNSTEREGDMSIRVMRVYLLDCKPFSLHHTHSPTTLLLPCLLNASSPSTLEGISLLGGPVI